MVNETLEVGKYFTSDGKEPHETLIWETRDINVKGSDGREVHNIKGVEIPTTWSELAGRVVATKYFYKGDGDDYQEKSARDLIYRVADSISRQGIEQGYMSEEDSHRFRQELAHLALHQMQSFNSPVWFNVGLHDTYGVRETSASGTHWALDKDGRLSNSFDAYERPQASACFILSAEDHMADILDHAKKEAMLFKLGSGTGSNFSAIRGTNEPLSGGGVASGNTSFMKIYDDLAGTIQAAGKTRRAAKMVILDCDHPDIYRFIYWKVNEERKGLWLSINPEWGPLDPVDLESEAYRTIDGQNGNNSVRLTDGFMEAALQGKNWDLIFRTADRFDAETDIPLEEYNDDRYLPDKRFVKKVTNKKKTVRAEELLEQIARAAAAVGDPGVQYDDNINKWNTCPNSGRINASNPCSEYMFLDNSACNLASLNLTKFSNEGTMLDHEAFRQAVRSTIIAQDLIVDYASYPSEEVADNSHRFRPLGLGYTNIGSLLMENGLAYDSEEGRALASAITSLMTGYAYLTSTELAEKFGAFEEFEKNKEPMLRVLDMHREETQSIQRFSNVKGLDSIIEEAERVWDEVMQRGQEYGFRNAQTTLLAPTGTIGFMMDVDCTGIEPMTALKTTKGLAGGGSMNRDVASCVEKGLKSLGYRGSELREILDYIDKNGSVVGALHLKEEHYNVFATAFNDDNTIPVDGHLNMMAAVQPFLSGAISKTVNLPKGSTIEDIKNTYIKGWKLGLKSVCPYIDGSKGIQPVNIVQTTKDNGTLSWGERVKPNSEDAKRVPVKIGETRVHFIFGEYDDRAPGDSWADIFVEFGSSGSPFGGIYESWTKAVSRDRQRGAKVEEIIKHHRGATGVIKGITDHPYIKMCSSIEDMFAKVLSLEYRGDLDVCDRKPTPEEIGKLRCNVLGIKRRRQHYESRIKYIDTIMKEGKLVPVVPLLEDKTETGKIKMGETFCIICGHETVLSGANCRKCLNCGYAPGCG